MINWKDWTAISTTEAAMVTVTTIVLYASIIALVRLTGLRSFSKMSASDFAMTVAIGTLFAGAISKPDPTILVSLLGLSLLFAAQKLVAIARSNETVKGLFDNTPILLMRDGVLLDENLEYCSVTPDDIRAKLREANATSLSRVHAVIFETTGDVSVLHGDPDSPPDPFVLEGIRSPQDES